MKRLGGALLLVALLILGAGCTSPGEIAFPKPTGYVNDFAHLLSEGGRATLEARLVRLAQDTGAELVVVTTSDLQGLTLEEYAVQLFERWGIGQAGQDNGVLLLLAPATVAGPHHLRIEVGYGLEPVITDGRAGRILDDAIVPAFNRGDYETALTQGASAIEAYLRGTAPPNISPPPTDGASTPSPWWADNLPLLVILGYLTIYLMGFMARSKSIWLGGIWGVLVGLALGFMMGGLAAKVLMPLASGGVGLFLDTLLSRNYRTRVASGRPTSWWSSGGGFSGGYHGGGFSSGGGFGGFGGGHSGGAGASR